MPRCRSTGYPRSCSPRAPRCFAGGPRGGGRCAIEVECDRLGVRSVHSSPYHPQTCGKVERFHQTLERWLARQLATRTVQGLQADLDRFGAYYNAVRPHRGLGRRTPAPG
jgi:transposase InsO family protein